MLIPFVLVFGVLCDVVADAETLLREVRSHQSEFEIEKHLGGHRVEKNVQIRKDPARQRFIKNATKAGLGTASLLFIGYSLWFCLTARRRYKGIIPDGGVPIDLKVLKEKVMAH